MSDALPVHEYEFIGVVSHNTNMVLDHESQLAVVQLTHNVVEKFNEAVVYVGTRGCNLVLAATGGKLEEGLVLKGRAIKGERSLRAIYIELAP